MPIYEYKCDACEHTLEALQKMSDPKLTDCPECASPSLRRLLSAPSFRLKGGGWYETDFKSGKDKKRNLADGPGGGGSESGDKGKSGSETKSTDSGGSSSGDTAGKSKGGDAGGKSSSSAVA